MRSIFFYLAVALLGVCGTARATVLNFDQGQMRVHYEIDDKVTGTIQPRKGDRIDVAGRMHAKIEYTVPDPRHIEFVFERILSRVWLTTKRGGYKAFDLDVPRIYSKTGYRKKFVGMMRKFAKKKMVFELQPTGQIVEKTGALKLLQKIRKESADMLAKRLVLEPINQFFLQFRHLAGQELQKKVYRLPISSFFPTMMKERDKFRPISYTFTNIDDKHCFATIKGGRKISKKGMKNFQSVEGTCRWDIRNPYLQRRNLVFVKRFKNKNVKYNLRTRETWKPHLGFYKGQQQIKTNNTDREWVQTKEIKNG